MLVKQILFVLLTVFLFVHLPGNETMDKLKQLFTSSSQKYGGLILDLHHNRFGPTALFQVYISLYVQSYFFLHPFACAFYCILFIISCVKENLVIKRPGRKKKIAEISSSYKGLFCLCFPLFEVGGSLCLTLAVLPIFSLIILLSVQDILSWRIRHDSHICENVFNDKLYTEFSLTIVFIFYDLLNLCIQMMHPDNCTFICY